MMRWVAIVGLSSALVGLTGCPHTGAAVAPAAAATAASPEVVPSAPPVSFELYDQRISALLPVTTDADQRDRLQSLRALLQGMRQRDPAAQAVVRDYLAAALDIEERTQPVSMTPGEVDAVPIAVETLGGPDGAALLAQARELYAQARYDEALEAVTAIPLDASVAVEAAAVRKEAIDAWARERRERAGEAFLAARGMPEGPERRAAIEGVRRSLVEINQRYPGNAYAEQIRENVARVDAELATLDATP